ncbi:SDR family oxidoreductase [Schumannella luteola]
MPRTIDITVPDQSGRLALITGGSDGVGLEIAARLARAGAEVILPVRNAAKGRAAADTIRERTPGAIVHERELDLSSLRSVAALADGLLADGRPLDVLINNAGIMTPPTRQVSADGVELQLATNHLGHFSLTNRLIPLLREARGRVVSQVSIAANQGAVNWDDLNWEKSYDAMAAYSSSKIAFGLFAMELNRRSEAEGWGILSALSHPGVTPTNLLAAQPGMGRPQDTREVRVIRVMSRLGILGTPQSAALPAVLAATSPDARGGRLYGPSRFRNLSGPPAEQPVYSRLTSEADARRIWDVSEQLLASAAE